MNGFTVRANIATMGEVLPVEHNTKYYKSTQVSTTSETSTTGGAQYKVLQINTGIYYSETSTTGGTGAQYKVLQINTGIYYQ